MSKRPAQLFEPIRHSVYIGRRKLGRYSQTKKRRVEARDAEDRLLGVFTSRAKALAAISKSVGPNLEAAE
jgi:hypothetical protein